MTTFDVNYPSSPWDGISTNQRTWYDPFLREVFLRDAVYSRLATPQFSLAEPGSPITTSMRITSLIPPHGNFDTLGLRDLWMLSSYVDTFERELVFARYGGKLAYHKYDCNNSRLAA